MAKSSKRSRFHPKVPGLLRHSSGQGRAILNGVAIYFGAYDDPETKARYAAKIKEWEAGGRKPMGKVATVVTAQTMREAFDAYEKYLDDAQRYHKNGAPTVHRWIIEKAIAEFCKTFGKVPIATYAEAMLLQYRDTLEATVRLSRKGVNRKIMVLKQGLRWLWKRRVLQRDQWLGTSAIEALKQSELPDREHTRHKRAVTREDIEKVAAKAGSVDEMRGPVSAQSVQRLQVQRPRRPRRLTRD